MNSDFYASDPAFDEYLKLRAIADAKWKVKLAEKEAKKEEKANAKASIKGKEHADDDQEIEKTLQSSSKVNEQIHENQDLENIQKVFQCHKCNKTFKGRDGLIKHLAKKNPCDAGKPRCPDCGKTFNNPSRLKRHLEERKTSCAPIVNNVAPIVDKDEIKCEFCGKSYKNLKCLDKHKEKCKILNNKKVFNNGKMQPGMEVLLEKVDAQHILQQIEELKQILLHQNPNMVNNFNSNINYNTLIEHQNVLNINCFGQQTFDHIEANDIIAACNLPEQEVAPYLTKKIHGKFENRNLFMRRINDNEVLVLREINGRKIWCREGMKEVCKGLFKDVLNVILKNDSILTKQKHKLDEKIEYIRDRAAHGPDKIDVREMKKVLFDLREL